MAVNKVYGAIALKDEVGALNTIDGANLSIGDIGFVVAGNGVYFYRVISSSAVDDSPNLIKPATNDNNKRWSIISPVLFSENATLKSGKFLSIDGIKAISELIFQDKDGNEAMRIFEGKALITAMETATSALVTNLNAEFLNGKSVDEVILADGSNAFNSPVGGVAPTAEAHLTTKAYVDDQIETISNAFGETNLVTRDGTKSFTAAVSGQIPTDPTHLTTKSYVDGLVDSANTYTDNSITALQAQIEKGHVSLGNGVSTASVTLANTMPSTDYVIQCTLANVTDVSPLFLVPVVTSMTTGGFSVKFSASTDSANYVLHWVAIKNW